MTFARNHRFSKGLIAAAVLACTAAFGGLANAAPAPTITTASPYVSATGSITVNGTGCEANGDAILHFATGYGTPDQNYWGTAYPISTDSNGTFTTTYPVVPGLADGTVITIIGQCPFTQDGTTIAPITVTVGQAPASTTTTVPPTSAAPSTAAPTTTTTAVAPAKVAKPLGASPTYTG